MALESGTWIEDLVVTNPPSTDDKRQGDDHLRLIKAVLKNSLKRTSGRPVFFPTSVALSSNYTVLDVDESTVFRCDTTSAPFTLTLPNTLSVTNSGWRIFIIKVNAGANPVFIVPPTGLLDGFTKVRRTAENKTTQIMWTGVGWSITRPDTAPIGTVHEYYGAALPNGYLWPDGGSFVASDFAELNSVFGGNTKPDLRGRAAVGRDDMGGSAAGRVTGGGSGIAGTTLRASGGTETVALSMAQLAAHSHGINDPGHMHATDTQGAHQHSAFIRDPGHTHNSAANTNLTGSGAGSIISCVSNSNTQITTLPNATGVRVNSGAGGSGTDDLVASAGAHTHTALNNTTGVTMNNAGSGSAHQNMPPALVCNKIIVAE